MGFALIPLKVWPNFGAIMYGSVADSGLACATNLCRVYDFQCVRF